MRARAKTDAQDIADVAIPSKAFDFLHDFFSSLKLKILEAAATNAKARERGRRPGRVELEDVLRATQKQLPAAIADIDTILKLSNAHVRNAS